MVEFLKLITSGNLDRCKITKNHPGSQRLRRRCRNLKIVSRTKENRGYDNIAKGDCGPACSAEDLFLNSL